MNRLFLPGLILFASGFASTALAQSHQWTPAEANEWYARQPWIMGTNYIQSNTVNQFDMFQPQYFDADRIDLEFKWAEDLGMNTVRVFLHDLLWKTDSGNLKRRMNKVLSLADDHKMKVIFVLFDSSGDPFPEAGAQRNPKPGVRDSLWAQSPGAKALTDPKQNERLLSYVKEVIAAFSIDKRVLAWDLWNQPDNLNPGTFGPSEPSNKLEKVLALLPQLFDYARAALPTQPITSSLWKGDDWSSLDKLSPFEKIQIQKSDIITFQNYVGPQEFEKRVKWLKSYGRPVICTGFLARPLGSTPEAILPVALKYNVGALTASLVQGKRQMFLPYDSWANAYLDGRQPAVWFQDIFHSNGTPYKQEEVDFIRQIIKSSPKPVVTKKK
jgi:hypothetical protein